MKPARPLALVSLVLAAAVGGAAGCGSPPADPGLPYLLEGEAALAEGDPETAVAAYQVALAAMPGDVRALAGLLEAQVANGEGEAALETLAQLEERAAEPVNPCPTLALATRDRLASGAPEAAEATARRARAEACPDATPNLARVLAARAEALAASGERSAALASYREAIALDPEAPELVAATARLLLSDDRVGDAVALLADGLARHPEDRTLRDLMVRALTTR